MICSWWRLLLRPRQKDPSGLLLANRQLTHGSTTCPLCLQSRHSGRNSRHEGPSGLLWLSVTALWPHSQQNSIPKPTHFHENIFNLIQIRNPVSLPSYFLTKAPSQMLKVVRDDLSPVDWKGHNHTLLMADHPPGLCSPRTEDITAMVGSEKKFLPMAVNTGVMDRGTDSRGRVSLSRDEQRVIKRGGDTSENTG